MILRRMFVAAMVAAAGAAALAQHAARAATVGARGTQPDAGKEIYLRSCKECHGVLGAPTKASLRKYDKIPDFTDSTFFKAHPHEELLDAVEKGKGRDMKGFADKLTKEEMKAVVAYIHTLARK